MSQKFYLSIQPSSRRDDNVTTLSGNYVVSLREDTPDSCLASAAYDTLLRYFGVENSEDFRITTRDEKGQIVLDTALPAIGSMASFGLSAKRLDAEPA